jgi:RNA polymerase sigma factor (TIGR02999 family)
MVSSPPSEITGLLIDWSDGNPAALEKLLPLVERELRRLAHSYMRRENPDHTLQTTALVNEAYLKLVDQKRTRWQNRAHFFGIAAQIMRRILLNYARDQNRMKRGGRAIHVSLSKVDAMPAEKDREIIALNDALIRLEAVDERKARVVELRYFGGLSVDEVAEVLGIAPITVMRDWQFAKAWLARELQDE